jgi:hypothetical protein
LGEGGEECRTIVGAIVVLVGASTIVILGEVNWVWMLCVDTLSFTKWWGMTLWKGEIICNSGGCDEGEWLTKWISFI